jgi:hypothetical protein
MDSAPIGKENGLHVVPVDTPSYTHFEFKVSGTLVGQAHRYNHIAIPCTRKIGECKAIPVTGRGGP